MQAIRAAKAFTGRDKVLKMEGGYHGSHDAAEISIVPRLESAGSDDAPRAAAECEGLFRGVVDSHESLHSLTIRQSEIGSSRK